LTVDVTMAFRVVGQHALCVEVANTAAAQATYAAILSAVESGELAAPRDVIPAARTVLLDGVEPGRWQDYLASQRVIAGPAIGGDVVRVSLRYNGPDLAEVAAAWGCAPSDVPRLHLETTYTVAFCGFAPGFAYCTGDIARPPVPRRSDPRTRVPAGSVALAGEFCGIYPTAMPGGWQLIGRTELVLFDVDRAQPALLKPGDRVQFEGVA
jgi:KipI family sensor histidine kinase inhibitor